MRQLKSLKFEEEDDNFNLDEMEKHFKNSSNYEDEVNFNVEKFDLNKFLLDNKPSNQQQHSKPNNSKFEKVDEKTISQEIKDQKISPTTDSQINKLHSESSKTNQERLTANKPRIKNTPLASKQKINNETNQKANLQLKEMDKVISEIKQRHESGYSTQSEIEKIRFPTIDDKKFRQQSLSEEELKTRGKSSNTQNSSELKLPILQNSNNYNYNIINNNSQISDVSDLSEKSKISSNTHDSRHSSKISLKSKKVISSTSIMTNSKANDMNRIK
jgi:hypothetical protein